MSEGKEPCVSPISGTAPPVHGQWKPGQSGNPEGGRIRKKWLLAIEEAFKRSDEQRNAQEARIKASVAMVTRAHNGDVAAYKELVDREDGKVPQAFVGDEDLPPIQAIVRTIVDPKNSDS